MISEIWMPIKNGRPSASQTIYLLLQSCACSPGKICGDKAISLRRQTLPFLSKTLPLSRSLDSNCLSASEPHKDEDINHLIIFIRSPPHHWVNHQVKKCHPWQIKWAALISPKFSHNNLHFWLCKAANYFSLSFITVTTQKKERNSFFFSFFFRLLIPCFN